MSVDQGSNANAMFPGSLHHRMILLLPVSIAVLGFDPDEDSFVFRCFVFDLVLSEDNLVASLAADEGFFVLAPDEKSSSNSQEAS